MNRRRRLAAAGLAVILAGGGALGAIRARSERPEAAGLRPFADCADLTAYLRPRAEAEAALVARGWYTDKARDLQVPIYAPPTYFREDGAVVRDPAAADIARVAGDRLVALRHDDKGRGPDELQVVDIEGDRPTVVGRLAFKRTESAAELIELGGDRVLVLGSADENLADTALTLVDLADPARPSVVRRETVTGTYVSARLRGSEVSVVIAGRPPLTLAQHTGGDPTDVDRRNLARVAQARAEELVPAREVRDGAGAVVPAAPLLGCTDVLAPTRGTGIGTITVLGLDTGDGGELLERGRAFGVVGTDGMVTFSADRLYIGTPSAALARTDLHAFTTAGGAAGYLGSGSTRGYIPGPWALSPHKGHLRVLTTAPKPDRTPGAEQVAAVTIFAERDHRLEQVGELAGLEMMVQLDALHWAGDRAAVSGLSAFDDGPRVSPYLLGLADPAHPRVLSHPPVPGYVGALYPAGDGRVLAGAGPEEGSGTEVRLLEPDAVGWHGAAVTYRQFTAIGGAGMRAYAYLPDARLALVPAGAEHPVSPACPPPTDVQPVDGPPDEGCIRGTDRMVLGVALGEDGKVRAAGDFRSHTEILRVLPDGDRVAVLTASSVTLLAVDGLRVLGSVGTARPGEPPDPHE